MRVNILAVMLLLAGCGASNTTVNNLLGDDSTIDSDSPGVVVNDPVVTVDSQTPTTPTPTPTTPTAQPGECVDTAPLNDGYGWDGVETCTLQIVVDDDPTPEPPVVTAPEPQPEPVATTPPAPPEETMPMDIDWSWAIDEWFGCRVVTNDQGNRWTWKLQADGVMVDQFNVAFGAWSLTSYEGSHAILFLDQGGRQDPVDIWIDENSFVLHSVGTSTGWGICNQVNDPIEWLAIVEPGEVNNRPHSRFDNTRWRCSIRVGPTWVEGYTIELHRNGEIIGYEQRYDSQWRPFGTQGNPRYFSTWTAVEDDSRVQSDYFGRLTWDPENSAFRYVSLQSTSDQFRCYLPEYFASGTLHPQNTVISR